VFGNIKGHPDARTYPGLIIFRFDQMLFFANTPKFRSHVKDEISASDTPVKVVLIDGEDIPDIDSTALDMLLDLREELMTMGVDLRFARLKSNVEELMRRASLLQKLGDGHIFLSVRSAVDAFLEQEERTESEQ
jgi:MFS superfamily sulfate permease-like transporter